MDRDFTAIKEWEFTEATNCFSGALDFTVAHSGELARKCVDADYTRALPNKAREVGRTLGLISFLA